MKKAIIIITSIIFLSSIVFALAINITHKPEFSPSSGIVKCQTLVYNGEGKTNIVIFSSEKNAKKYSDALMSVSPFDKNKNQFNFYYIDNYQPECETYKGIALLCYNKEILQKASSCPNDYIVVLKEKSRKIRSSAYMNLMSINTKHPLSVISHEFGHVFATLADEYTPSKIPPGAKNCVSDCKEFDISDGCFEECSRENYFRSIKSGIMRTLNSKKYGIFNEKIIQEKITSSKKTTVTAQAIKNTRDCSDETYFLITGTYSSSEGIKIIGKTTEEGCLGTNGAGTFEYSLLSENNQQINTGEFNPELIFTDFQDETLDEIEGQTFENEGEFLLKVPIIKTAKTLTIKKDSNLLAKVNLEEVGNTPCKI